MDAIDEALLNAAQGDFPVAPQPFVILGEMQGIDEDETIERFRRMKAEGLIRYFGPVIATKALGFKSTLCAFKIPPGRVETAANIVSSHPGVSHNYERDDLINLWFTLAVPPDLDLECDFQILAERARAETALFLPSIKTYKIRMVLDVSRGTSPMKVVKGQSAQTGQKNASPTKAASPAELTDDEKTLLAMIEKGLEFKTRPFANAAENLETTEVDITRTLQRLIDCGPVRRLGVLLHHRRAGFGHNEMTAWQAPEDEVDRYGEALAGLASVSHAYQRPIHPEWPYNLYAMLHARSPAELENLLARATHTLKPPTPPRRLRSLREFKKQRLQYFTDAYHQWPR